MRHISWCCIFIQRKHLWNLKSNLMANNVCLTCQYLLSIFCHSWIPSKIYWTMKMYKKCHDPKGDGKFIIWYSIVPISRWTIMFITLSYTYILLYSMFWYLGLIFDNHCLIHFKCTWRNQLPCLFSLAMPKRTNNWTWKCTKITRAIIVNDITYFDINQ